MSVATLLMVLNTAAAPAVVDLCYNYGCKREAAAQFDAAIMMNAGMLFSDVDNAQVERVAISLAIGMLMRSAAATTPIGADRARNPWYQSDIDGRMDCIDHSTNATRLLELLEARSLLRYHTAGKRVRRAGVLTAVHWAATLLEKSNRHVWAVDTWFRDPGAPAVVMPLKLWQKGGDESDVQ